MITENNIKLIDAHLAKLSKRDYLAQKDSKSMRRIFGHRSYSLAPDTLGCHEMLRKALLLDKISPDDEKEVKAYVLKLKMLES